MTRAPLEEAELYLRELAAEMTDPAGGECLPCYVFRMLPLGCRGLRWARRYRALRAPAARALERRLRAGGAYCDCEIFGNAVALRPEHQVVGARVIGTRAHPDPMPPCGGVRTGSTQPCALWEPRSGYGRW